MDRWGRKIEKIINRNFRKYYINGNRFTVYITYRNRKYDIKGEAWWNELMYRLTRIGMKKEIRKRFRQEVFERDHFKCVFCDKEAVGAHHITDRHEMPNGGYVKENGISLCSEHHKIAEKYHESCGKSWVEGFHPDDLYRKIGSSKEIAKQRSK